MKTLTWAAMAALLLSLSQAKTPVPQQQQQQQQHPQPSSASFGFPPSVTHHLDASVNPCDDFYKFACGGWQKRYPMPEDESLHWLSTGPIDADTRETLAKVLQAHPPIIGDLFNSCLNTRAMDHLGFEPVQRFLMQIDTVATAQELLQVAGQLSTLSFSFSMYSFSFLTSVSVLPDDKKATDNVLQFTFPSLTLPDNSVYSDDAAFAEIEPAYREYISTVLKMAQVATEPAQLEQAVNAVVQLEKQLARNMYNDPDYSATYHPMQLLEASTRYPLSIGSFVKGVFAGVNFTLPSVNERTVIVRLPSYFEELENLLSSVELLAWKTLVKFQFLNSQRTLLTEQFASVGFDFHNKMLKGATKRPTRQDECIKDLVTLLPNLMGKYYAQQKFSQQAGKEAHSMLVSVESVMKQRIMSASWLDDATRAKALEKLAKVINLMGFSEQTERLDGVSIDKSTYFANTHAILNWQTRDQLNKLLKPVDRSEWTMSATEVNAYYDFYANKIVFPAANLQPPLFDVSYPTAVNYGAIGTLMGHELTHGFDNSGRVYDGDGNLNSWWTNVTNDRFQQKAQCIVDQYSQFELVSDFNASVVIGKVNGNLTLDENIADNSGFLLSFDAFQQRQRQSSQQQQQQQHKPKPKPEVDSERLFFVSYAQAWCSMVRDGYAKQRLMTDSHSPEYFRVNGVIMNNPRFGQLFNCPVGSKMNPKEKCELW